MLKKSIIACFSSFIGLSTAFANDYCGSLEMHVLEAVVSVSDATSKASGVIIAPNRIITAAHVVDEMLIPMVTIDGSRKEASVLWFDPEHDIALLNVDTGSHTPIPLLQKPLLHDRIVWAIGYPLGGNKVINSGQITQISPQDFHTSATINQGQSGGAMIICEDGRHVLAGMITAYTAEKVNDEWIPHYNDSISLPAFNIAAIMQESSLYHNAQLALYSQ